MPMTPVGWVPDELLSAQSLGGSNLVTPELAAQMQALYDQYAYIGQQPPFEVPQVGANATEYLTNLYYSDAQLATQLAESLGMDRGAFLDNVRQVDQAAQARRLGGFNPIQRAAFEIGEETEPLARAGLIVGTALAGGAAAAGLGGSGTVAGAGGAAADGLAPITLSPSVAPITSPVSAVAKIRKGISASRPEKAR